MFLDGPGLALARIGVFAGLLVVRAGVPEAVTVHILGFG